MTPNRRLDQIEPIIANVAQKTDRLIEGQGQILEIATRAEYKADLAAKCVADLTIITQQQFNITQRQYSELKTEINSIKVTQDGILRTQDSILQYLREKLP